MSLFTNFCRNMSKRSYQYMVRSTYAVLPSTREKRDSHSYKIPKQSTKEPAEPLDKNGRRVWVGDKKIFQGKEYKIVEVCGKMVTFEDGTKHRASSLS